MNERSAQRCMQIAREVPEGSLLEGMNMTKVRALLTLPQAEREDVAREMDAANASAGEVEEKVRAIKAQRDEALRVIGAQKDKIEKMRRGHDQAVDAAVKEAIRVERRDAEEARKRAVKGAKERASVLEKNLDDAMTQTRRYKEELFTAQSDMRMLRDQLTRAQAGEGIGPLAQVRIDEQQAQIEHLKAKLRERESELDELSEQLDDAQMQAARGGMAGEMRIAVETRIISAIGALMADAGRCIGELREQMDTIDAETRELLIGQASMVGTWAMNIIAACGGDIDGFGNT